MNKASAEKAGLVFTGHYDWDKNKVKKSLESLRAEFPGVKFYLVNVPPNPLSRGHHGMGYSIYAHPVYDALRTIKAYGDLSERLQARLESARADYENKVADIHKEFDAKHEILLKAQKVVEDFKRK